VTAEEIARVCHEVNRAYCLAIGDASQVPWEEAQEWQRWSAVTGVEIARANPSLGPDEIHQEWLETKREQGWKHGPVKDPEKREHPSFVPFDDLPPAEKAKDYIFLAVVRALS
jgi:hypothetical protein